MTVYNKTGIERSVSENESVHHTNCADDRFIALLLAGFHERAKSAAHYLFHDSSDVEPKLKRIWDETAAIEWHYCSADFPRLYQILRREPQEPDSKESGSFK